MDKEPRQPTPYPSPQQELQHVSSSPYQQTQQGQQHPQQGSPYPQKYIHIQEVLPTQEHHKDIILVNNKQVSPYQVGQYPGGQKQPPYPGAYTQLPYPGALTKPAYPGDQMKPPYPIQEPKQSLPIQGNQTKPPYPGPRTKPPYTGPQTKHNLLTEDDQKWLHTHQANYIQHIKDLDTHQPRPLPNILEPSRYFFIFF